MSKIDLNNSILVIIDVQEKLVKMLSDENVKKAASVIAKAAGILNVDAVITEQYPKGLGETVIEIKEVLPNAKYVEKTNFSAFAENDFKGTLKQTDKKQIIILGIETHICVLQTAIDLLNSGYEVFVVKNACGSRCDDNKQIALNRLMHLGCQILTTEMVLFEWLKCSKHPNFKEVQALIK